ncbi:MAG: hypothetical protein JWM00_550 [Candidatus Saccharibacteria bacterium]|nr:hypothetical protein [Candidatus Saccharibacteria bacterium]
MNNVTERYHLEAIDTITAEMAYRGVCESDSDDYQGRMTVLRREFWVHNRALGDDPRALPVLVSAEKPRSTEEMRTVLGPLGGYGILGCINLGSIRWLTPGFRQRPKP